VPGTGVVHGLVAIGSTLNAAGSAIMAVVWAIVLFGVLIVAPICLLR
jgi:hypothetical protein